MGLGERRARDSPLGRVAMTAGRVFALPFMLIALSACNSVGGFAGAAAGITSGAATANPAVGYAVAVGVEAATDASVKYVMRELKNGEQHVIAQAAGGAQIGQVAAWRVDHALPFGYGNAHGTVEPIREIVSPLTTCREVAIQVGKAPNLHTFISTACEGQGGWQWAAAEPAVSRWGALQ